jgi:hypothetical protein
MATSKLSIYLAVLLALAGCSPLAQPAHTNQAAAPAPASLVAARVSASALARQPACMGAFVPRSLDFTTQIAGDTVHLFDSNGAGVAIGDLDIVVNNLRAPAQVFENRLCGGSSLEVDPHWPGSRNTHAIGARLALYTDAGTFYRDVRAGSGYLSGDPARIHFGFPAGATLQRLEIRWPDGAVSSVDALSAQTLVEVTRS